MDSGEQNKKDVFNANTENGAVSDTISPDVAPQGSFTDWIATRSEKLITALYMVTDYMPEREPMRLKLRKLGIAAISDTRALSLLSGSDWDVQVTELSHRIGEVLSLLSIAQTVGIVSPMNHDILDRQFTHLVRQLKEHKQTNVLGGNRSREYQGGREHDLNIDERFFSDNAEQPAPTRKQTDFKGQSFTKRQVKDTHETKGHTGRPVKNKQYSRALEVGLRVERRNMILRVLKEQGSVAIKDISEVVTDCSDKTLQRMLQKLIKEGLVKKTGKRRWSRYSLA